MPLDNLSVESLASRDQLDQALARLEALETRLTAWHDYYAGEFRTTETTINTLSEQLDVIEADLAKLTKMADDAAAAYAASPVGKLMASRRKLKAPDAPAT